MPSVRRFEARRFTLECHPLRAKYYSQHMPLTPPCTPGNVLSNSKPVKDPAEQATTEVVGEAETAAVAVDAERALPESCQSIRRPR